MPSFDVCDLFCFLLFLSLIFFCKYQGLFQHLSKGLEDYCLTSSPVKLTRDACIIKSKTSSCLLGGEMSHVIFMGQSVVCQKKGVGHVFFINRPTYSPKRFGQSPISTSRFIQLAPPSSKLFSGQENTDPRYNSPASYAGYCLSLLVLFSQLISQRFLVYRCFPQSHMKNQKLYSIWK